jgi:hypothetical protein
MIDMQWRLSHTITIIGALGWIALWYLAGALLELWLRRWV